MGGSLLYVSEGLGEKDSIVILLPLSHENEAIGLGGGGAFSGSEQGGEGQRRLPPENRARCA